MRFTLRKEQSEIKYAEELKKKKKDVCIFCERELLKNEWSFWILIANRYPYDKVCVEHDMLCPKRHIEDIEDLTFAEFQEFAQIKKDLEASVKYDAIMLNMPHRRSILPHLHFHLLKFKEA